MFHPIGIHSVTVVPMPGARPRAFDDEPALECRKNKNSCMSHLNAFKYIRKPFHDESDFKADRLGW